MITVVVIAIVICLTILALYFLTPMVVLQCRKRRNQNATQNSAQECELQTFNQAHPVPSTSHVQVAPEEKPPAYEDKPPAYEDLFNQA